MSKKLIELDALTAPSADDVLYITDSPGASPLDRKVTYSNLVNFPYGSFSSNADQTCTGGTTADAIIYQTTDCSNGITLSNNSRINIATAGTYLITFSAVTKGLTGKYLNIWMAVNGSPVANSNTISKFIQNSERIITVTYIYTFTAGQYFELYMWSDDANTIIDATGTQSDPTRPACPGIIVTANKIGS